MRRPPSRSPKHGFTLVEVMVAGSILALLTCALLEGIIVAVKISHENAQHLSAEALAFDLAWLHFNRNWDGDMVKISRTSPYTIQYDAEALAPTLASTDATARVHISRVADATEGVLIHSEVTWGAADQRKTVSHDVFRGSMSRVAEK